nr:hypothetical protein [uncultured Marinifilum sp.]
MLKELIKNTHKYFWNLNSDGDVILGSSDLDPKARVTFTYTKKWVYIAPIVEDMPGTYIGKPEIFLKKTAEYEQVVELIKLVKAFLKTDSKLNPDKTFKNTMKLLRKYYQ